MALKARPTSDPFLSYEDFEPFCKWQTDLAHDTLEVHLQGFKKDQLRVQINNNGVLIITGERPLDEKKRSRFRKETKVPKECKTNEIHARFSCGILYITMPKKTLVSQDQPTLPQQKQENEKPKPDTKVTKDSTIKESSAKENVTTTANASLVMNKPKYYVTRVKSSFSKLKMGKKTTVRLAVAVAVVVMVALGAYMTYKYHQSSQDEN